MRVQSAVRYAQQLKTGLLCGVATPRVLGCPGMRPAAEGDIKRCIERVVERSFASSGQSAGPTRLAAMQHVTSAWRGFAGSSSSSALDSAPAAGASVLAWRRMCSAAAFTATRHGDQATAVGGASAALPAMQSSLAAGLSHSAAKQVSIWLGFSAAWVASMVVLGGITRLTRSGLSMTDWKFTGETPPQSQADWDAEFSKYQLSPEFQKVNSKMTLDEFKFIYWMEYTHRMWGRALGLVFAVPAAYFVARGVVRRRLGTRLGLLFLMGGTQGLVGWWMVKSGLQAPEREYEAPRVSPYRLAAHLASAFSIYALLMWSALSLAAPVPQLAAAAPAVQAAAARLRGSVVPLSCLIAVTAASGAFVAGLDAGHAYNTFPLMGGRVVPEEYCALPGWRNAFENTAAVQFHHRVLALSTLAAVGATWLGHRKALLPASTRRWLAALAAVTAGQVALGVTTLLTYVPVSLGSAHQANALALFSVALALLHSLRRPMGAAMPAARFFTPLAAAATVGVWAVVLRADEAAPAPQHAAH